MQIQIDTVHAKADDELLEIIAAKLGKLVDIYDRIEKCKVILKEEKNDLKKKFKVEVRLAVPQADLFASEQAESFGRALDRVLDDLKRQLIKHKQKLSGYIKV